MTQTYQPADGRAKSPLAEALASLKDKLARSVTRQNFRTHLSGLGTGAAFARATMISNLATLRASASGLTKPRNAAISVGFLVLAAVGATQFMGLPLSGGASLLSLIDRQAEQGSANRAGADATPEPVIVTVTVGRGDTLMRLLTSTGVAIGEAEEAVGALKAHFNPRKLRLGQEITVTLERDGEDGMRLAGLSLQPSVERSVTVFRENDGFASRESLRPLERRMARAGGEIEDSLYATAIEAGVPNSVLAEAIRIFSFDVDFQRDIQKGDKFEIFFERFFDDAGKVVKPGRIVAASMVLSGQEYRYYQFDSGDGQGPDYYTSRGQSVKKALLKTPIDGARLTSGFGKRHHPVLGYSTMHRGIDFAATIGTPIQAAGDGVVEVAGWNGGYGRYVRIRHGGSYTTAYAHMSRLAVAQGMRVRQGQVIGHVGSTGLSTGPHLHYEILNGGKQVNPNSVKLPSGRKLEGKDFARFQARVAEIDVERLQTPARTWLADAR